MGSVQMDQLQTEFCSVILKANGFLVSQFITWLDVKVAEYKVYGHMILTNSNLPNIQWLRNPSTEPNNWPRENLQDGADCYIHQSSFNRQTEYEQIQTEEHNMGASTQEQNVITVKQEQDHDSNMLTCESANSKILKPSPFKQAKEMSQLVGKVSKSYTLNQTRKNGQNEPTGSEHQPWKARDISLPLPYTEATSSRTFELCTETTVDQTITDETVYKAACGGTNETESGCSGSPTGTGIRIRYSSSANAIPGTNDSAGNDAGYTPLRGMRIEKAKYAVIQAGGEFPQGYEILGGEVAVKSDWLRNLLSRTKRKHSSEFTFKKLLDGFFDPKDLAYKNSSILKNNVLVQACADFAVSKLRLSGTVITKELNSKCATAKRAIINKRAPDS